MCKIEMKDVVKESSSTEYAEYVCNFILDIFQKPTRIK